MLLPTEALAPFAQYTVRLNVTVKGQATSLSWRFTTGDGTPIRP